MSSSDFPRWDGLADCVFLHAIINATMTSQHSYYASLLSWDCRNFVLNCGDGTYGAVTFDQKGVIGVFFDAHSSLSPFTQNSDYTLDRFFSGMPSSLRNIAENETLKYNRQHFRGDVVAVVTAAFWSQDQHLDAAFPWSEVLRNGAHILDVELNQNPEKAIAEWKDAYQMTADQITFVQRVFERRLKSSAEGVVLSDSEFEWLRSFSESDEAMEYSLRAFAAMGINTTEY